MSSNPVSQNPLSASENSNSALMNLWEAGTGKRGALFFSATQLLVGVYLSVSGGRRYGSFLINSAMCGGLYAYQFDETKKKYTFREYLKQSTLGAVGGYISGAVGSAEKVAGYVYQVVGGKGAQYFCQILGAWVGTAVTTAISDIDETLYQQKVMQVDEIFKKSIWKASGGLLAVGTGAIMGEITHHALDQMIPLTADIVDNFVLEMVEQFGKDVPAYMNILRKMFENSIRSGSSQLTTGLLENYCEKDPEKKKDRNAQLKEAFYSAFLTASLDGIIMYAELYQTVRECNQIKSEMDLIEEQIKETKKQRAESKKALKAHEEDLKSSQENLVEKQNTLNLEEQSLRETQRQLQDVHAKTEQNQQNIDQAQRNVEAAEKAYSEAQQAFVQAQESVNSHQEAVKKEQTIIIQNEQKLLTISKQGQEYKKSYEQVIATIDEGIRRDLKHSGRAKIHGKKTNNVEEIRAAFLRGEKIKWKKHTNLGLNKALRDDALRLNAEYTKLQRPTKRLEQRIQELKSGIQQKQSALTLAEQKRNAESQSLDNQAQEGFKVQGDVHNIQATLEADQNLLSTLEIEHRQKIEEMSHLRELIDTNQKTQNQLNEKIQLESDRLKALSDKKSGLSSLTKEQQAAILNLQKKHNISIEEYVKNAHLQPVNHGMMKKALSTEPVTYVDCNMKDLIPHVVLVHAIPHTGNIGFLGDDKPKYDLFSDSEKIAYCVEHVVKPEGTIGDHLDVKQNEFFDDLPGRPHLHWAWNQLVQGNVGGDWEAAKIAFLEPLATFEESLYNKPFSVTPYDTFTFKKHHFSAKSILLIPKSVEEKVRQHLTHFRGRIVSFDDEKDLRSVVIDTLHKDYPETWHICDEEGNLIGKEAVYSGGGYRPQTCIKPKNGEVIVLIKGKGSGADEKVCTAFQEWDKEKRYIGLHCGSFTYMIEESPYFMTLRFFKKDRSIVKDNCQFAGNLFKSDVLAQLGTLEALELYQKALEFDRKTASMAIGDFYINEAIYADLVSLFYQKYPSEAFDLSVLDLEMIFATSRNFLINLLENIQKSIATEQYEQAMEFFNGSDTSYCSILEQCLISVQYAKKKVECMLEDRSRSYQEEQKERPLCLVVANDQWELIAKPESVEFDLGKNWPHSPALNIYANTVIRTLPVESEGLMQLYGQLLNYYPQNKEEQYRINILCSLIKWSLQEEIYLKSRNEYNFESAILVNKLSRHMGWLGEYGLETEDLTKNIGDCLFDNVIAQLPADMYTSLQLRKAVMDYMRYNHKIYSTLPEYKDNKLLIGIGEKTVYFENWDQYLDAMSQPTVWGTELEIKALAAMLYCPLVILTADKKPKVYQPEGTNPPLFLHHLHGNHFEACFPFKGLDVKDLYENLRKKAY